MKIGFLAQRVKTAFVFAALVAAAVGCAQRQEPEAAVLEAAAEYAAQPAAAELPAAEPVVYTDESHFTVREINGGLEITGYTGDDLIVHIPSYIGGLPVVAIGVVAFQRSRIESVSIPATVTNIAPMAFMAGELTSVVIPDGAVIEFNAFALNPLVKITIGYGVTFPLPGGEVGDAPPFPGNFEAAYIAAGSAARTFVRDNERSLGWRWEPVIYDESGFHFRVVQGGAEATGYAGQDPIGAIPDYLGGLPVVSIGSWAFAGRDFANIITIPRTVTEIGHSAFRGGGYQPEPQAISVDIPHGVTAIGLWAFALRGLHAVSIPESVTVIGNSAFAFNELTQVSIPSGITTIEDEVFAVNRLTDVTIPHGVTTIGRDAFSSNRLTNITIPESVTAIGAMAFTFNQLVSIDIPHGVTIIEERAFDDNQLASVTIPQGITTIMFWAFNRNPLTSVTIGEGVTFNEFFHEHIRWPAIPGNFYDFYVAEGRAAGTFVRTDTNSTAWQRQ